MSLIVAEVYEALIEAGASKEKAKAAASAIPLVERLATREVVASLEKQMATKADIANSEKATKEDIARLDKVVTRMDKKLAVLNLAVFSLIPAALTLLVKLVFFP